MPSPSTAYDSIVRAMRKVGILAAGEIPEAFEAVDALAICNDVLEQWSIKELMLWGQANQTFPLTPAIATYTMGPGGAFNTARPTRIDAAYSTLNGVDFPAEVVSQINYNYISLKTDPGDIIEQVMYVNDNPFGLVTVWPVPLQAITLTLTSLRVMTAIPSVATSLVYPPGYMEAFEYEVGLRLGIEYGEPLSEDIKGAARAAIGAVKKSNDRPTTARFDSALMGTSDYYDWRRGY
jgi:hypothetical protein